MKFKLLETKDYFDDDEDKFYTWRGRGTIPDNVSKLYIEVPHDRFWKPHVIHKENIQEIIIGDNIINIWSNSFRDYMQLKAVSLPSNLASIGSRAFSGCYNLNNMILPKTLAYIGCGAFEYCSQLPLTELPNNLEILGAEAFKSCKKITSCTIHSNIMEIGDSAFDDSNLTVIKYLGTVAEWQQVVVGDQFVSADVICMDGKLKFERQ